MARMKMLAKNTGQTTSMMATYLRKLYLNPKWLATYPFTVCGGAVDRAPVTMRGVVTSPNCEVISPFNVQAMGQIQ